MRKRILLSVATASALVLLGACGSSSATSSTASATTVANTAPANASSTGSTMAGSVAPGGSTPTSGAGANTRAALQAWEACLTKNGVTLPSTATGAGGFPGNGTGSRPTGSFPRNGSVPVGADGSTPVSGGRRNGGGGGGLATINSVLAEPANAAASAACKSLQPTFGAGGGAGNTANRAAYQAYLSCLSSNGVTVPTVDTTQTSQPQGRQTVDTADPNFATANAKCSVLLPQNTNGSAAPQTGASASTATTGA